MHIALLFSGHKRSFMKHVGRWRELINDLEKEGAVVNCFFHSWTVDCTVAERNHQRIEGSYVKIPLENRDEMVTALPFKAYCFEDEEPAEESLVLPERAFLLDKQAAKKNIGMQLYSMQRSYEIMRQWERNRQIKHQTIVKLRFDTEPRSWNTREFFLSNDERFKLLLIAANDKVHRHPGGGGGCVMCDRRHQDWWDDGAKGEVWLHDGDHGNDICDFYAIGNRLTMDRYMTVYSRATELYPPELFQQSLDFVNDHLRKQITACSVDDRDLRIGLNGREMEDSRMACFYPERLQRLNLKGFTVLHAASKFYRD